MATDERVVVEFDQHSPEYRETYPAKAHELREQCPVAWSTQHDGFWVVTGHDVLSAISKRTDLLSNDHDPDGERNGYQGISIPERGSTRGGFIEMDPPEQSEYRRILNPFLSPAAVKVWDPFIADFTRACIDDVIETGRLDFVDDFANVVPAVLTMAMLGLPLADWEIYCEPAHMQVYTAPDSPNWDRMIDADHAHGRAARRVRADPQDRAAAGHDHRAAQRQGDGRVPPRRRHHRHGHAAHRRRVRHHHLAARRRARLARRAPRRARRASSTTRATSTSPPRSSCVTSRPRRAAVAPSPRTARSPGSSSRRATGCSCRTRCATTTRRRSRTPTRSCSTGSRTRTPRSVSGVHRCIGSNLARLDFKYMLREALRRMPDYRIDHAGKEQYESIGTINGYKHLPATFTPGRREGPPLAEVMTDWQARLDAEPAPENLRAEAGV